MAPVPLKWYKLRFRDKGSGLFASLLVAIICKRGKEKGVVVPGHRLLTSVAGSLGEVVLTKETRGRCGWVLRVAFLLAFRIVI